MISSTGTTYKDETPDKVVKILEWAQHNHIRIRLFYGDSNTGRDWLEEYDTIGYIGRSGGLIKIPLLIKNTRSWGEGGLLDHCIVKITMSKHPDTLLYEHPTYHHAKLIIKPDYDYAQYKYAVYADNILHARFETLLKAEHYIEFLDGKRNTQQ